MLTRAGGLEVADFRRDVARWIVPQSIGDSGDVSFGLALRLLSRHPPLRAMAWIRFAQWCGARGVRGIGGIVQRRLLRVYGLELSPSTPIGGGLYIAHPVGCVLHAAAIGENVTVIGQVTFGYANDARWPTIGDRAYLGVGARVLGGITVGADARVGANAVVLTDVPAGATAVGIPARVLSERRA